MAPLRGMRDSPSQQTARDRERPSLSVIVFRRERRQPTEACLRSLGRQDPPPDEVLVAGDGVEQRNAVAAGAAGDVLAFLAADCLPQPGWAAAIVDAFGQGAMLVAGGIAGTGELPVRRQHDPFGRRDFLPSASADNLAISRRAFEALGGFD